MNQMTMGEFLNTKECIAPELIICSLTQNFHWLRISTGHTPIKFSKFIAFQLNGYDYIYEDSSVKNQIISVFNGIVSVVPFTAQ